MARKCVRIVGQGIPVRMSDADAARIIAEGDGELCPKSVWKNFHDTNADERYRERCAYGIGRNDEWKKL